ncbi:uncharacterized protein I303_101407 [Kwoniella dejecticola CBS 10117]|uniref:Uncharacterized protein n=1 Tax=Kwoniella dejecticola CBS 10117 TaxID=1296121 RepID=A0A1A6AHN9_9TREE|nr:uncharacterized protein I303_01416 [Kwoniella dejecticola CBS 10117]OBR89587.1 hypothetical protein I303_01416 [Kwoniella dejecticola CBS 10117]
MSGSANESEFATQSSALGVGGHDIESEFGAAVARHTETLCQQIAETCLGTNEKDWHRNSISVLNRSPDKRFDIHQITECLKESASEIARPFMDTIASDIRTHGNENKSEGNQHLTQHHLEDMRGLETTAIFHVYGQLVMNAYIPRPAECQYVNSQEAGSAVDERSSQKRHRTAMTSTPRFPEGPILSFLYEVERAEIPRLAKELGETLATKVISGHDCRWVRRPSARPKDMSDTQWASRCEADRQEFQRIYRGIDWDLLKEDIDLQAELASKVGSVLSNAIGQRRNTGKSGFKSIDQIFAQVELDPWAVTSNGPHEALSSKWAKASLWDRYRVLGDEEDKTICLIHEIVDVNQYLPAQ